MWSQRIRITVELLVLAAGDLLAALDRFTQLFEETQHFCRGCQKEVANIVQCGEQLSLIDSEEETTEKVASSFVA